MTSHARNYGGVNLSQAQGIHNTNPNTNASPTNVHAVHGQHTLSHAQRRRLFVAELSQCLLDFVVQLLPTQEEMAVKEDVRKLLERLIRTIEPESRLLSFGSTANGFSLRNSDMDLCCLIDAGERLAASDLVAMVGDLLERETKFHVKPLPHARIPIVKLSLDPSPGLPLGIACDIGFENRLALENTRLLLCYSMVDPTRVRTLVLFLKVWSKRRKINSPYKGTLSSYGYVLLVIYFLVHVKNPPVLPNLQQIPPLRPIPPEESHMGDRNIWFFDDIELLRQRWQSSNNDSVAELLIDFFRYYARDFSYNTGVASIRAGLLKKDAKGWQNDNDPRFKDSRERNRLCIEDPFETDYNVSRCVTKDGLYLIRGEFMRACRILAARPERAYQAIAQLCEERDDNIAPAPTANSYVSPRISIPPQTPYSVGTHSFRPRGAPERERLPLPRQPLGQDNQPSLPHTVASRSPPEHMAPKRTKWTSPPPPEAPEGDHVSFADRLGLGISLATSSTDAREHEKSYLSSSSNSEILSDDGEVASDIALDDDVKSVQSFTGEPSRAFRPEGTPFSPSSVPHVPHALPILMALQQQVRARAMDDSTPTPYGHGPRGRRSSRPFYDIGPTVPPVPLTKQAFGAHLGVPSKLDIGRRSNSGPSRVTNPPRMSPTILSQMPFNIPLPPSPVTPAVSSPPTIYYETNAPATGRGRGSAHSSPHHSPHPSSPHHSSPQSPINPLMLYQQQLYTPQIQGHRSPDLAQRASDSPIMERRASKLPNGAVSAASQTTFDPRPVHTHSQSSSTIIAPTTPGASSSTFSTHSVDSQSSSPTHSPARIPLSRNSLLSSFSSHRNSIGPAVTQNTTTSIDTPSPPSSASSRSASAGSASPTSTSPRTVDLNSPISPSSPVTAKQLYQQDEGRRQRVESAKFIGTPSSPDTHSGTQAIGFLVSAEVSTEEPKADVSLTQQMKNLAVGDS